MVFPKKSLVDCRQLHAEAVVDLYDLARKTEQFDIRDASRKMVGLVFLEPSTRTRCSFEVASHRLGIRTFVLEEAQSSRAKGETLQDTLLNFDAMDIDLLVVRHGGGGDDRESLGAIAPQLKTPVINAGEGTTGHPTQGLLDLFTVCEQRGVRDPRQLKEKFLFVGDLIHSRVAKSNFELLKTMNIPFAFAAPQAWVHDERSSDLAREWNVENFSSLEAGLKWATVVTALRVQRERHLGPGSSAAAHSRIEDELIQNFQLNAHSLRSFSERGLILHPGPVNWGVELSDDVRHDPRTCILKQVAYGVAIRVALMARLMELV